MSSPQPPTAEAPSDNVRVPDETQSSSDTQASSSDPSPQPTASHDSTSPPVATRQALPPLPQVPWRGEIPNFFVMGPNGILMPHFHPRPSVDPSANTNPPNVAQHGTGITHQPEGAESAPRPPLRFPNPMFSFFMPFPMNTHGSRPDPEAAAELLRSLPTVTKGLLRRVDKVAAAEQVNNGEEKDDDDNKGWKCGICLEGVEDDAKETGVKVLPCNHLFHGACLEPWFTTKHTCPTCRLDLDPGRTLRANTRQPTGRPRATGAGRQSAHPYTRENSRPGTPGTPAQPPSELTNPLPPILPPMQDSPNFSFVWRMRNQEIPAGLPASVPSGPIPSPPSVSTPPSAPPAEAPSTPTLHFDVSFTASPATIERDVAPDAPLVPEMNSFSNFLDTILDATPNLNQPHVEVPQPGPPPIQQPRPTVPHFHLVPPGHHLHAHHHHHHHHLRPPGLSTPFPARASPEPEAHVTREEVAEVVNDARVDSSDAGATTQLNSNTSTVPEESGTGASQPVPSASTNINTPHFHFFFDFSAGPPPSRADMAGPAPAPQEPARPAPPTQPVERPSLEAWVKGRERLLGWRCDAPDCGIAPPDDDDDDLDTPMCQDSDKEMLSIYSALQPLSLSDDHETANRFELHACEHRWHRTCLETVERTAGRNILPDGDGRVWVRCERCRKDGWIRPRGRPLSEGEVERLVVT